MDARLFAGRYAPWLGQRLIADAVSRLVAIMKIRCEQDAQGAPLAVRQAAWQSDFRTPLNLTAGGVPRLRRRSTTPQSVKTAIFRSNMPRVQGFLAGVAIKNIARRSGPGDAQGHGTNQSLPAQWGRRLPASVEERG